MASAGWELTESDPGIFSQFLWEIGVQGIQCEELFGLDGALIESLKPIYAFIFLFKWQKEEVRPPMAGDFREPMGPFYFALQTINNACATLAILNAVLNIRTESLKVGEELDNLLAFSGDLDAEMKGSVLTNSERLREVHNSFARSNPFALDEFAPKNESEDAYHFVTFLPIEGNLYELDGLKPLPISHGSVPSGDQAWIEKATDVIQGRMATYATEEIHFNLMAIVADRAMELNKQITEQEAIISSTVQVAKEDAQRKLIQLQADLADEEAKRSRWAFENAMRRHNHIGLIHNLLVELAREGKLEERIKVAKNLAMERKSKESSAKS